MSGHVCAKCERGTEHWADVPSPELALAVHRLGWAYADALRIEQTMHWLDRRLRRWPWLYRHLGG